MPQAIREVDLSDNTYKPFCNGFRCVQEPGEGKIKPAAVKSHKRSKMAGLNSQAKESLNGQKEKGSCPDSQIRPGKKEAKKILEVKIDNWGDVKCPHCGRWNFGVLQVFEENRIVRCESIFCLKKFLAKR